jgi:hypothetical protein
MSFAMSIGSVAAGRLSRLSRQAAVGACQSGIVSWFFWLKAVLASRFMSRSLAVLRLSVWAAFLVADFLYVSCSVLSDLEYGAGLRSMRLENFQVSARLFPLIRTRRSGAAYAVILREDRSKIAIVEQAIRYDPNAADLWYGLARMQLKAGNEIGYNTSLTRLKELTPGVQYQVVMTH